MIHQVNIYLINDTHKNLLQHLLSTCPDIADKWSKAKVLLDNSVFREHLEPAIVIWGKRAGISLNKDARKKSASNKMKAYWGLYSQLVKDIDNGKPWLDLDRTGDEIFATMNQDYCQISAMAI